jgi:hypothetical protein
LLQSSFQTTIPASTLNSALVAKPPITNSNTNSTFKAANKANHLSFVQIVNKEEQTKDEPSTEMREA